jgi:hypothetical protein
LRSARLLPKDLKGVALGEAVIEDLMRLGDELCQFFEKVRKAGT